MYIELTDLGYTVYVDWIVDPRLDRSNVTKVTAELIRKRLKASKSLLLAISYNAEASKWMPWELGFVDGNSSRCGIIPISRANILPRGYEGREFLSLYPFIKKVPTVGGLERLFLIETAHQYVLFDEWLRNKKQPHLQNVDILKF